MILKNEINGVSGLIGLGYQYRDRGLSIIDMLYQNKQIDKRMFSQVLKGDKNKMYIGDFTDEINNNTGNLTKCNIPSRAEHWSCFIDKFYVGFNYTYNETVAVNRKILIFDSGTNFIVIDEGQKDYFLKYFFRNLLGNQCFEQNGDYFCNSIWTFTAKFPPIYFIFNNVTYKIKGEDLFFDNFPYSQLRIAFSSQFDDTWLLGQPFLKNFHVIYNYEDNQMAFYGGNRYNASEYVDNTPIPADSTNVLQIIAYISFFISLICLVIFIIYQWCKKPNNRVVMDYQNFNLNNTTYEANNQNAVIQESFNLSDITEKKETVTEDSKIEKLIIN